MCFFIVIVIAEAYDENLRNSYPQVVKVMKQRYYNSSNIQKELKIDIRKKRRISFGYSQHISGP